MSTISHSAEIDVLNKKVNGDFTKVKFYFIIKVHLNTKGL